MDHNLGDMSGWSTSKFFKPPNKNLPLDKDRDTMPGLEEQSSRPGR